MRKKYNKRIFIILKFLLLYTIIFPATSYSIPSAKTYCLRTQATKESVVGSAVSFELRPVSKTWIQENVPELAEITMATLSMEGHIPELPKGRREAVSKGGLGAYYGDKLEGLEKIGINAFGGQPLYRKRIRQRIYGFGTNEPYQYIEEEVCFNDEIINRLIEQGILKAVVNERGEEPDIVIDMWDERDPFNEYKNIPYKIRVFEIKRGGRPLYLFYSPDASPEVLDLLYTDTSKLHRFTQEAVLARTAAELVKWFRKNHYKVDGKNEFTHLDIVHINEGHVYPFVAILRGYKENEETAAVYTNHTIMPAGLERFTVEGHSPDRGKLPVNPERAFYQLGLPGDNGNYLNAIRATLLHGNVIDNCHAAAVDCEVCNAVSSEHAIATNRLLGVEAVPVLNGSGDHWVLNDILELERKGKAFSPDNAEDLQLAWQLHQNGKSEAYSIIEEKIKESLGIDVHFNMVKPTLWLARRMVEYKLTFPMLKDIIHVLCADKGKMVKTRWGEFEGLGMQVIVSGIAPAGSPEEAWVSEYLRWMVRDDLKGRFFYVPDCDTEVLRAQAIGSDICANVPEKEDEACGTSDERNARNFGLNIVTMSAGPLDYLTQINEKTGEGSAFFIGPVTSNRRQLQDWEKKDPRIYRDRLTCFNSPREFMEAATKASKMYYAFLNSGFYGPDCADIRWLRAMVNSYNASKEVTAEAMEKRYARNVYPLAIQRRHAKLSLMREKAIQIAITTSA